MGLTNIQVDASGVLYIMEKNQTKTKQHVCYSPHPVQMQSPSKMMATSVYQVTRQIMPEGSSPHFRRQHCFARQSAPADDIRPYNLFKRQSATNALSIHWGFSHFLSLVTYAIGSDSDSWLTLNLTSILCLNISLALSFRFLTWYLLFYFLAPFLPKLFLYPGILNALLVTTLGCDNACSALLLLICDYSRNRNLGIFLQHNTHLLAQIKSEDHGIHTLSTPTSKQIRASRINIYMSNVCNVQFVGRHTFVSGNHHAHEIISNAKKLKYIWESWAYGFTTSFTKYE